MKIIYLANVRIPTEKAHGIQIMKMAEAFKKEDVGIELVMAKRVNNQLAAVDPFSYYGINTNFPIKKLWLIDLVDIKYLPRNLVVFIQNTSFAISAFIYLFGKKTDLIYSRDEFSLFLLALFKNNLILELHNFPRGKLFLYKFLFGRLKKIIVLTEKLKELLTKLGVSPEKILVAPDGVDLNQFNIAEDKNEYRKLLNLPLDKEIVLYSGHLFRWKGVYDLLEAAKFLGQEILVVFVGGMDYDINKLKAQSTKLKTDNILIVGYQPPSKIPFWLKAADCLILPNSAKYKASEFYTSPLKLFEYMAAKKPIVASDLPAIREILNENNAILVPPDEPQKMAQAINFVLTNKEFCDKISNQAEKDVLIYSWRNRAKNILEFLKI